MHDMIQRLRLSSLWWLLLLLLCPRPADAQYRIHRPLDLSRETLLELEQVAVRGQATLRLAPVGIAEAERIERSVPSSLRLLPFAIPRKLELSPTSSGVWSDVQGQGQLWQLEIISPGARSIGLRLEQYHLPEGSALYLQGEDGRIRGAFTHYNNSPDGLLHLAPVRGERLRLLYLAPSGQEGQEPFVITELYHAYRDLGQIRSTGLPQKPGEPPFHTERVKGDYNCAPNILLHPEVKAQSRSVVLCIVRGIYLCSGALINNTRQDGTPYILSALHTFNNNYDPDIELEGIKARVASTVFFFGFESPYPLGNIHASEEHSLSGGELTAYNPESDMCLIRITGLPTGSDGRPVPIPAAYNAYFAGWSLSPQPSGPFYGIHHPRGLPKRYSQTEDKRLEIKDYTIDLVHAWQGKHWQIRRWAIGTTAAGSSGSPLFDARGRIIGALTGGRSFCDYPSDDYYFALHTAWRGGEAEGPISSLAPWLDPNASGELECPGLDPHEDRRIQRISGLYGSLGTEGLGSLSSDSRVNGVGNTIRLSSGEYELLGAYIVFEGRKDLEQGIPPLEIGLSKYRADGSLEPAQWQTQLHRPTFPQYQRDQGGFKPEPRSLSTDTLEVFVPALAVDGDPERNILREEGTYLLYCHRIDQKAIDLPLLMGRHRATSPRSWRGMTRAPWGTWEPQRKGYYWIDLLVRSRDNALEAEVEEQQGDAIQHYYYSGRIYVYLGDEQPEGCRLRVYGMDGRLMHTAPLSRGQSVVELPSILAAGAYIAEIVGARRKSAFKFIL